MDTGKIYLVGLVCLVLTLGCAYLLEPFFNIIKYSAMNLGYVGDFFDIIAIIGYLALFIANIFLFNKFESFVLDGNIKNHRLNTYIYLNFIIGIPISYNDLSEFHEVLINYPEIKKLVTKSLKSIPKSHRREEFVKICNEYFRRRKEYENRYSQYHSNQKENNGSDNNEESYDNQYIHCCGLLNLIPPFNSDELKKAYYSKVKQYHPDLYENSDNATKLKSIEMMKRINNAYEYLENAID